MRVKKMDEDEEEGTELTEEEILRLCEGEMSATLVFNLTNFHT